MFGYKYFWLSYTQGCTWNAGKGKDMSDYVIWRRRRKRMRKKCRIKRKRVMVKQMRGAINRGSHFG